MYVATRNGQLLCPKWWKLGHLSHHPGHCTWLQPWHQIPSATGENEAILFVNVCLLRPTDTGCLNHSFVPIATFCNALSRLMSRLMKVRLCAWQMIYQQSIWNVCGNISHRKKNIIPLFVGWCMLCVSVKTELSWFTRLCNWVISILLPVYVIKEQDVSISVVLVCWAILSMCFCTLLPRSLVIWL